MNATPSSEPLLRPLCFVIMPYGRKATQVDASLGPGEIDFNALWDRAYVPAIKALGYEPVRADQDTGAMIITQMLERIFFADLVLADMTIPNGNVYYEVGIRHASKPNGCVLLAATWSRPLFDVAQMRTVRYPLTEGDINEVTAKGICEAIRPGIAALAQGRSPMHEAIKGFPLNPDPFAASTMKQQLNDLAEFQSLVRSVRMLPKEERMVQAQRLVRRQGKAPLLASVAFALVRLLRDSVGPKKDWAIVLRYIDSLPPEFLNEPDFKAERAFAVSHTGKVTEAVATLDSLLDTAGPSVERLGLLGGRFKRLYLDAVKQKSFAQRGYLDKAIECYERGMDLDLNEFYCSSNLPRLYRSRNDDGDAQRAQTVSVLVGVACERAMRRGVSDEWLRPTWLAAAFDEGNADLAEKLASKVVAEGVAQWKIDSVLADIRISAQLVADEAQRARLVTLADTLALQSGVAS